MKKYIVALALVLIIPNVSYASVDKQAGVEFLSPLVQTIIQLLQDRIAVLTQEVELLKNRQPVQALCGAPVTQTPKQRADEVNAQEANKIRFEFSQKYIALDKELNDLRTKVMEPEVWECGGYGCPNRDRELKNANERISAILQEKASLQIEERRQLSFVGVY